jgi:hypothetical protein
MPRPTPLVCALVLLLSFARGYAHSPGEAIEDMTGAASAWLGALTPEQRADAVIELTSGERENWHYVPKSRAGLPLAKMDATQRQLARALLASGLSQHGLLQADSVIALERVLRVTENSDHRDQTLYYFTVFGTPATNAPWGWRVEGHHLSVNFTVAGGHVSATPNFVGANPAEVRTGGPQAGQRALAEEEDQGRAFVLSLSDTQRREAIISSTAPGDILTRNDRQAKAPGPGGLGFARMTPEQQAKFKALVAVYAGRLRAEVAAAELQKIADTGWERLSFAWAGSVQAGEGHYYRIQSPDFVIEYDNTQNRANHIHTVWRIFDGDFGRDLLREHYQQAHPAR